MLREVYIHIYIYTLDPHTHLATASLETHQASMLKYPIDSLVGMSQV